MGLGLNLADVGGAIEKLALRGKETTVMGTTSDVSSENYTIIQDNTPVNNMVLSPQNLNNITKPSELIAKMLASLGKVDLIGTLTDKIGDDLSKYQKKVVDEN